MFQPTDILPIPSIGEGWTGTTGDLVSITVYQKLPNGGYGPYPLSGMNAVSVVAAAEGDDLEWTQTAAVSGQNGNVVLFSTDDTHQWFIPGRWSLQINFVRSDMTNGVISPAYIDVQARVGYQPPS